MDQSLLLNLAAYSAQVACIVLAGAALPTLLRLDVPGVRLLYWRVLALLCLALPWLQGKRAIEAAAPAVTTAASFVTQAGEGSATLAGLPAINWPLVVGALLAAGCAARLLWMGAGLFYLRRLRSAGSEAPLDDATRDVLRSLGTRAQVRHVPGLTQPVTFGVLRPVVLLPDTLRNHDEEIQRAILAHELVHVQRRDWAWIVGEELVRAALWFHPAMWWLISRMQLAREEVVDEMVVTLTGKRRTYVEALLAFADSTPLSPAPAFAQRRHLFRRMMLISREAVMSSKRVVVSCAVMAVLVAAGGWYAVDAFPMQQLAEGAATSAQPGPLEKSAKPITPENPIPRRVQSVPAEYPSEAAAADAAGTIVLRTTLDATGRVAEVRRMAATVRAGNPAMTLTFTDATFGGEPRAFVSEGKIQAKIEGASAPSSRVAFEVADAFTKSAIAAVRQWSYDPPADAPISFNVSIGFRPDGPSTSTQSAPAPAGAGGGLYAKPEWTADGALRIGGMVKPPTKVKDVKPVYPEEAKAARIRGVVIIEARIEPDGTVGNARVLRSVPLLDQAALDAVMQWQFVPTLMNGQPVPVIMTVTVNFTLQ